jgi:hypothetical protein
MSSLIDEISELSYEVELGEEDKKNLEALFGSRLEIDELNKDLIRDLIDRMSVKEAIKKVEELQMKHPATIPLPGEVRLSFAVSPEMTLKKLKVHEKLCEKYKLEREATHFLPALLVVKKPFNYQFWYTIYSKGKGKLEDKNDLILSYRERVMQDETVFPTWEINVKIPRRTSLSLVKDLCNAMNGYESFKGIQEIRGKRLPIRVGPYERSDECSAWENYKSNHERDFNDKKKELASALEDINRKDLAIIPPPEEVLKDDNYKSREFVLFNMSKSGAYVQAVTLGENYARMETKFMDPTYLPPNERLRMIWLAEKEEFESNLKKTSELLEINYF